MQPRAVLLGVLMVLVESPARSQPATGPDAGTLATVSPEADEEDEGSATSRSLSGPAAGASALERDAWLAARVDAALAARPELARARVGIAIGETASSRELVARRGDDAFNVASNAKLVTAAAALAQLGAEYRFRTALYADERKPGAPGRPGVLAGDLVLRGGGDPTLSTADLAAMVEELYRSGLRQVEGSLVIDATFFDEVGLPPAFAQKMEDFAFRAPVSATALNRDAVSLRIVPGEAAGAPARALPDPPSDYLVIVNEVVTVKEGRNVVRVAVRVLPEGGGLPPRTELKVRGTLRLDAPPQLVRRRIDDPERYTGESLRTLLTARGIRVARKKLVFRAISPTARPLVEHTSVPLGLIVRDMGKQSDNFVAETVLKTLGAEIGGAPGTWTKGLAAARVWLESRAGLAPGSFRLDNGSGLYDSSRFSPRQMVAVLRAAWQDFRIAPDFLASLAIAGADGTLARRMASGPAERLVRAKTGTLKDVICLAGYAGGQSGRPPVAFAVLVNDLPAGAGRKARALGDEIAAAVVLYVAADPGPAGID